MKFSTICSIGLVIAFFLPWIDLTAFTINGYEIPTALNKLSTVSKFFDNSQSNDLNKIVIYVSICFYLIPIFSIIGIVRDLSFSYDRTGWLAEVNGFGLGFGAVMTLYYTFEIINKTTIYSVSFSSGLYLTALFSIIGFISTVVEHYQMKKRDREKDNPQKPCINEEFQEPNTLVIDKVNFLDQLSQLHSLFEKNVITKDIYEQERLDIMSKMQRNIIQQPKPFPEQYVSSRLDDIEVQNDSTQIHED